MRVPSRSAPPRPPAPRRKPLWKRAVPIFVVMMGALFVTQFYGPSFLPENPITSQGSIWLSLIFGFAGAYLISRFATEAPPPPPSKTQARRQATASARAKHQPADPEAELVTAAPRRSNPRRNRRRR